MGAWRMFAYINEETVKAIVGWAYNQLAEAQADAKTRFGDQTSIVDVSNIEAKVSDTYEGGNRFSRYVEGEKIYAIVYPTYDERFVNMDSAIDDLAVAILEGGM